MGFRVDDHQSKLSENGEPQPGVAEGPADFAYQVGFAGRSYEFISAPFFHRRVELVVGPIRAAVEHSLIDDGLEAFSPGIRNERLLGRSDLRRHRSRSGHSRLLSRRDRHQAKASNGYTQ